MGRNPIFLSAKWNNLILCNYPVSEDCLKPYLPPGCELDRFEGNVFVSLVTFQFLDTRVFGFRWPGFTHFPEVNLRFYIKFNGERGVCFIREYVPSFLIANLARFVYNEPYKTATISDRVNKTRDQVSASYQLISNRGFMSLEVVGENSPYRPSLSSMEHFFKEHELGVGKSRTGETLTYKVEHPHWDIYPVLNAKVQIDWIALYGSQFGFLSQREPHSIVFAKGSEIKVFKVEKP